MSKKPHVKPVYGDDWVIKSVIAAKELSNTLRIHPTEGSDNIITQDSNPELWVLLYDAWDEEGRSGAVIHNGMMYNVLVVEDCVTFIEQK